MKKIHKYPIAIGISLIQMPAGAKILTVHEQHGSICIWAEINTERKLVDVTFRVHGTGHEIIEVENSKYIGTVFMDNGYKVWHVYKG